MRIVLDTNVLVTAFISHGACAELFEYCAKNHELYMSVPIVQELTDVLVRTFCRPADETATVVELLKSKCEMVEPERLPAPACRDRDDDVIIGTARAGKCQAIITGDKDLLVLGKYGRVMIVSPVEFWRIA